MRINQLSGIVVLVAGVVFLVLAYHASNSPLEQLSDKLTGRYTNETMWYFVVGIGAAVGGALLFLVGKRN